MATEEHKRLADLIKKTHATLREESRNYGSEVAWERHVAQKDVLQRYSTSMHKLATTFWSNHNVNAKNGTYCRMEWIKSQCKEYFFHGGKEKYWDRELSILEKINSSLAANNDNSLVVVKPDEATKEIDPGGKVTVLDVGSCYNPLGTTDLFDVTAVDLIGVPGIVLQCDFLNVDIGKDKIFSENNQVSQLPETSFDIVIFSLLLEYLPCPEQRFTCCKKAYDLLKNGGILIVISPDSKHVGANAKFMKSWRYVLSKLGFMRIKYEKMRHIHCMIYRKCTVKKVALRWAELQDLPNDDPLYQVEDKIYIPQDFQKTDKTNDDGEKIRFTVEDVLSTFNELPFDA